MRIVFTHNLQLSSAEEEAEFDKPETVALIADGLRRAGHEVEPVDVAGPASRLVARLEALAPDLIFNTAEGSRGRFREGFYPALFDQLGFAYTGSDAYVCTTTLDKQFTKLVLHSHGIPTPGWRFVDDIRQLDGHGLRFPVIVKPNFEGSSMGISADSVVADEAGLRERVSELLLRYPAGALVEEYITGRDLVVPYLEAASPDTGGVLEPAVYDYNPEYVKTKYPVYDYAMKTLGFDAVTVKVPADVSAETRKQAMEVSARVYRILGIRDAARIDYRVTEDGAIYFLEINALPSLEDGASLYRSGALAGLTSPADVLGAIVDSAVARQGLAARALRRPRSEITRFGLIRAEGDPSAPPVRRALESYGHEVVELDAAPELPAIAPASELDLAFNLARGVRGRRREAQVPALLELLGIEFCGSDSAAMSFAFDKPLCKRLVQAAGWRVPGSVLLMTATDRLPPSLAFPVVVKPISNRPGVTDAPRVFADDAALRAHLGECDPGGVVVESYVAGRELVVGLIGETRPKVLPLMEVVFPEDEANPVRTGAPGEAVEFRVPADLPLGMARKVGRMASTVFEVLGCRDYARMVWRIDDSGQPVFIACTPQPPLGEDSDMARIASAAGLDFRALIGELVAPAQKRLAHRRRDAVLGVRS